MNKFIKIILLLSVLTLILCGCNKSKIEIPSEVTEGYILGDYDIYAEAAKVNGKKYDKLYVLGNLIEEPFEDGDLFSCYFVDENNKKYLLKLDSKNTELKNDYINLKNRQICACGIYGGSLKKDPMPVIYINKIYDIKGKKTIVSKYYGDYIGVFDENGKIISGDYDEDDNTYLDFHSIQINLPYNYMEDKLEDNYASFKIHNDGEFIVIYDKQDLKSILEDYFKKTSKLKRIKEKLETVQDMYDTIYRGSKITNLHDGSYNNVISFDVSVDNMNGNGAIILKDDGYYLITLLNKDFCRFNRTEDFKKIEKSLKKFNSLRQPRVWGTKKMVVPKE